MQYAVWRHGNILRNNENVEKTYELWAQDVISKDIQNKNKLKVVLNEAGIYNIPN